MLARYRSERNYTKSVNNAIGATTDTVNRTVTAHTDSNSKYVAMNGNDSTGTGTSANPYLTIDKAISTLGGAFTVITIERNGYVGDMAFTAPYTSMPASSVLQTELGEKATLTKSVPEFDAVSIGVSIGAGSEAAYGNGVFISTIHDNIFRNMYRSTDKGLTWSATGTSHVWSTIAYGGGTWVAYNYSLQVCYYSTDAGLTWTASTMPSGYTGGTLANLIYGNGLFVLVGGSYPGANIYYSKTGAEFILANTTDRALTTRGGVGDGYILLSGDPPYDYMLKSYDGINYTKIPTIAGSKRNPTYCDGYWVCGFQDGYVGISDDGGSTWEKILIGTTGNAILYIAYGDGLVFASEQAITGTGRLWYARTSDLTNWQLVTVNGLAANDDICGMAYGDGVFIAPGGTGTGQSMVIYNHVLLRNTANTVSYNGLVLNGDDITGKALLGDDNTGVSVKWCDIKNTYTGIQGLDTPTIQYCKGFDIDSWFIDDCNNPIVLDSLLYRCITGGINHYGNTINLEHLTIYECGIAIYLNNAITTTTAFKNHIFDRNIYDIVSAVTNITLSYSLINGIIQNVTLDSTVLPNIAAMFEAVDSDNYNIKHLQDGYPTPSPAVDLADDSRDSGCYDVSISLTSETIKSIIIDPDNINVKINNKQINVYESTSINGYYKRSIDSDLWTFEIDQLDSATTKLSHEIIDLKRYNEVIQLFPVSQGLFTPTNQGAFVWKQPSSADGVVECVISSVDNTALRTFLDRESCAGLYMWVLNISGATSPFTTYPYKIQLLTSMNTLMLENVFDRYPGTGFSSPPDGDYTYKISKAVFVGIAEYLGDNVLSMPNLLQDLQIDSLKGFMFHLDYTNSLGSRTYFRVVENDEKTITFDNPLSNTLPTIGNDYYISVDLIMVQSEPDDTTMEPLTGSYQLFKNGGGLYNTKIDRETNVHYNMSTYLHNNLKNTSIKLIESKTIEPTNL